MDLSIQFQMLFQLEKRKWLIVVVFVAATHLFCQTLMLPYENALLSLVPDVKLQVQTKGSFSSKQSYINSDGEDLDNDAEFVEDESLNHIVFEEIADMDEDSPLETAKNGENAGGTGALRPTKVNPGYNDLGPKMVLKTNEYGTNGSALNGTLLGEKMKLLSSNGDQSLISQSDSSSSRNDSAAVRNPAKKKMRCEMPPRSITLIHEMNRLLIRNRARSRAMRPRWSSARDQEIQAAKLQIERAPNVKNDKELYAPLFRNISMFRRSYELMEQILRVYVYREGEKPIFHQPILKGLYASEGWFMKLMEGNKRFVVKDPRKAHLFYMPFSARMLEYTLYVRNSHNRTNLRQYLKSYSEKIAARYPFWNRTGGADHFLVACHDWAPYETRHHMEHCIKALCNADVTAGFKIGRDVSLPETYVRSARNPLRDLGGNPPSRRHILAFYAGNNHGYLRPILLNHWRDRDPDMKIFGAMPPGVSSKMNYIHHMKSSKFCICPKGYEVNSPRVVEAIFYECVPVIISDNFVPPFFEVLNWDSFSLIVAEKDIPNLKEILLSVSEEKYVEMQLGVRRVQRHFLWHAKPVKYDLFHMTLHSIWHNRVFQTKLR